jgi:hypothetical protein
MYLSTSYVDTSLMPPVRAYPGTDAEEEVTDNAGAGVVPVAVATALVGVISPISP